MGLKAADTLQSPNNAKVRNQLAMHKQLEEELEGANESLWLVCIESEFEARQASCNYSNSERRRLSDASRRLLMLRAH